MTDRELLELAAEAAGVKLTPQEVHNVEWIGDNRFIGYMTDPSVWSRGWFDPLKDDGDALRVLVALRLEIAEGAGSEGEPEWWVGYTGEKCRIRYLCQKIGDDPAADARRAIVRGAAEVGRSMRRESHEG